MSDDYVAALETRVKELEAQLLNRIDQQATLRDTIVTLRTKNSERKQEILRMRAALEEVKAEGDRTKAADFSYRLGMEEAYERVVSLLAGRLSVQAQLALAVELLDRD